MDYRYWKFWKSVALTAVIMGLLIWLYILADSYLYAVATILNGVLVVAGFLFVGLLVFLIVYAEPGKPRTTAPWDMECQRNGKS